MKNGIFLLVCFFIFEKNIYSQNLPDGSPIPGSITNIVTIPSPYSLGSSPVYNYTRTFIPQSPVSDETAIDETTTATYLLMNTNYSDGFGRTMQTISRYQSNSNDLITPYDYRLSTNHFSFLPYPAPANSTFDPSSFSNQNSFYGSTFPDETTTATPTSVGEASYQSNSAGFYSFSYSAGKSNVGELNGIQTTWGTNYENEVIIWAIDPVTSWPSNIGYYAPGTLVKKATFTADGGQLYQYYDNERKLISECVLTNYTSCTLSSSSSEAVVTESTDGSGGSSSSIAQNEQFPVPPPVPLSPWQSTSTSSSSSSTDGPSSPSTPGSVTAGGAGSTSNINCPNFIQTYYVYDIYDRLTYTLKPKAVEYLYNNSWVATSDIVNDLCDYIVYDNYGRMEEGHQAGMNGNVECVFDNHNRVALSRKPNDAGNQIWWWYHYDQLNRLIEMGSLSDASSTDDRADLQSIFDNSSLPSTMNTPDNLFYYLFWENQQGVYPSTPVTNTFVYNLNYYDNYNYPSWYTGSVAAPFSFTYDPSIFTGNIQTGITAVAPPTIQSIKTMGMLTYQVTRSLTPFSSTLGTTASDFLANAQYYDDNGRPIETIKQNNVEGQDIFCHQYDFCGRLLSDIGYYTNSISTTKPHTNMVTHYYYNLFSMTLSSVGQSIDGNPERNLASYTYNNLGQTSSKNIGGIEYQGLTYNIRGQLTGINADYAETGSLGPYTFTFGESIKYDQGFTNILFCGNITGILWRDIGSPERAYGYTYDNASRLIQSDFREFSGTGSWVYIDGHREWHGTFPTWNNTYNDYTEGGISYDVNGNIKTLNRYGPINSGSSVGPGMIDNLSYNYASTSSEINNHVQAVTDAIPIATTTYTNYDFKNNGASFTTNYTYDNNGNLLSDNNKGVTIDYYYNDKPKIVNFTTGTAGYIFYSYDALGNKNSEYNTITGNTIVYDGQVEYENNNLYRIPNQEGYALQNTTTGGYDYYFYVKDHLGNVRNLLNSVSEPFTYYYFASHEIAAAGVEDMVFDNIEKVRADKPESTNPADMKTATLDAADSNTIIGTAIVLKVMGGDKFDISVNTFYPSSDTSSGNIDEGTVINSLISTLVGAAGGAGGSETKNVNDIENLFCPNNMAIYNSLQLDDAVDSTIPLAFINYILFDENFKIIPEDCGSIQIAHGADVWNSIGTAGPITVHHHGYLAVFMSTATAEIPVSMDALTIHHYVGNVQDVNHYYPFGLAVNLSSTYSSSPPSPTNPIKNQYLYQTNKQEQTNNLYLTDFGARQYDPQLGRYLSVDAANQFSSSYTGMGNNPVSLIDPTGNDAYDGDEDDGGGSSYCGGNGYGCGSSGGQGGDANAALKDWWYALWHPDPDRPDWRDNDNGDHGEDEGIVYGGGWGSFGVTAYGPGGGGHTNTNSDGQVWWHDTWFANMYLDIFDHSNFQKELDSRPNVPDASDSRIFGSFFDNIMSIVPQSAIVDAPPSIEIGDIAPFLIFGEEEELYVAGEELYTTIGSTGVVGENYLLGLGGESKQFFRTDYGARFVDQFASGIIHESKVGYTPLTSRIMSQIKKDAWLMGNNRNVDGAMWHFFRSPVTGKGGPTAPLKTMLQTLGIKVVIH